jgi:hypothetical protein
MICDPIELLDMIKAAVILSALAHLQVISYMG